MEIKKLKIKMLETDNTIESLANQMGISRQALHRKMKIGKYSLNDVIAISQVLNLTPEERNEIFFNECSR